ncbi:putative phosphatidylglycerol/phosphatidylinositol transfer protein DDB_G0282179 [Dioscorea cayenensis subsp. rotundata]|uniref:Phosphatidylglycerol/phosphatidylinositol transfer protein DDB_G0282179 n=1 Tax=Dioscorea cayennensis subsp. rotundata TaxID=55577 RepID=A0AB40CRE0_DIOCR|nr:putative phosphatidylglycerol/phosphatidylinositol transfer protein DDB_G0282179 [Dioscorea cayenensis subsp. rotundata]
MAIDARFLLVSALFLMVCLLCSAKETEVSYCDKDNDYDVKVTGLEISPFPVKRGRETSFSISAQTGLNITSGKLLIDVEYIGIHIQQTKDLCKETSCPVSTGDFVLTHKETLPFLTPPGTYTLVMTMVGEDGKKLTCITFDFYISFWAAGVELPEPLVAY